MNRRQALYTLAVGMLAASSWSACQRTAQDHSHSQTTTFTCPMHPQIVQEHAGTCPICGMDLVPFDKNQQEKFLLLNERQQALADISTVAVGVGQLADYTSINGRLTVNPNETNVISSRNTGRVEQLYVKETGIPIRQGQPLLSLYSEQLLTLQEEFLMTHKQAEQFQQDQRFQAIFEAAQQKLLLYGQTKKQLQHLLASGKTSPYVTIYAPTQGVVAEMLVTEGQYIEEGASLFRLEGYQSLWVEADLYPNEAKRIKEGQTLQVIVNGNTARPYPMKVSFITPALEDNTQLSQLRGTIDNVDQHFQAGMPATILLPQATATDALMVPSSALIHSGKNTHIWVAIDKEKFEPRQVETGATSFDHTEIISGLKNGEKVVVNGAYLLYSEYVLKKGGSITSDSSSSSGS